MNYYETNLILQAGCINCPICHNTNKWSYKYYVSGLSPSDPHFSQESHNCTDVIVNSDNKVRFIIGCRKCNAKIETEYMELINEKKYEEYTEK